MKGNRRRDTKPELAVRRLLHSQGLRYRVDYPLPFDKKRSADILFTKKKIAVFIDGCFWHGCPTHFSPPGTNRAFWVAKIEGNRKRDARTNQELVQHGWVVLRYWTHDDPRDIARDIAEKAIGPTTLPR